VATIRTAVEDGQPIRSIVKELGDLDEIIQSSFDLIAAQQKQMSEQVEKLSAVKPQERGESLPAIGSSRRFSQSSMLQT
jgi:hypothetical protein